MDTHSWDEMYRSRERVFSGAPHAVLVAEAAALPPGRALDVGCGEGADASWPAGRGWQVTAVDIAPTALQRAAAAAPDTAGHVVWTRADLTAAPPPAGAFDLVSVHYFPLRYQPERLPVAPGPVEVVGLDGRRHVLRYRLWRAPTGISVRLVEECEGADDGFEFAVFSDHDADVDELAVRVRAEAEAEIARCYVEPALQGAGWRLTGEEIAGRLIADLEGGPVRVVVDGRTLSWDELGEALASYEGWRFRLAIDASLTDVRSDAAKAQ
ncbi:class I SAM-dependent methyltransferase [Streptomyces sp. MMS24-I2-30]|uniref:class I SAM-dependent methyltransferase n=1 Tax=Streptomyces sp. MMS24-I2-30 TaxID=3351564 RepID=UPI003896AC03